MGPPVGGPLLGSLGVLMRPVPEEGPREACQPGLWWDFGAGPVIDGVAVWLFCAWLASVEPVPGGTADPGQDAAHGGGVYRRDAAPVRGLFHLSADRQLTSNTCGRRPVWVIFHKFSVNKVTASRTIAHYADTHFKQKEQTT